MPIDFMALTAPFRPEQIYWRVGATNGEKTRGLALAYIDARVVYDRLDEVCGPAGWQCRYPHANSKTVCEIGILVGDQWVWKANGAGDTDHEAEKGALSDALKRAAVAWGIGRYLYDLTSPWVEIEPRGKSFVIKDSEFAKLARLVAPPAPMASAAPTSPTTMTKLQSTGDFLAQCKRSIDRLPNKAAVHEWLRSPALLKDIAAHSLTVGEREQIKDWARRHMEFLAADDSGIPPALDRRPKSLNGTAHQ